MTINNKSTANNKSSAKNKLQACIAKEVAIKEAFKAAMETQKKFTRKNTFLTRDDFDENALRHMTTHNMDW